MKAKMCKVLSLTLAMVLAFTLIPARELAASTNEDTSTDTVQTEEEAPADSTKDDKAENPSDDKKKEPAEKAPEEKKDEPADKTPAEKTGDPEEKKQDEEKDVQQDNKQPGEKTDEVAETTSATPDEDKKAPEPKNANQNRGTGDEKAFVVQPKGGTVEPGQSVKIGWETNFNPTRVEVGYWEGNHFYIAKFVSEMSYGAYMPLDKEYSTDLEYDDATTSDKWMIRAYYTYGDISIPVDSALFTINKSALKFVAQPKGGMVEPLVPLNIEWETNFNPTRVEVGYWEGNHFYIEKFISEKLYGAYMPLDKEYSTDLEYADAINSDKWMIRAYYTYGDVTVPVDSSLFTITKGALKFVTQPQGGTVEPLVPLNIEWETNFKPWRIEVGYLDGNKFNVVKELKNIKVFLGDAYQYEIDKKYDTSLTYSEALNSDNWIIRAYYGSSDHAPYADSAKFSINKGALKFVTQPKAGTVDPMSLSTIEWETNFKPWRVEVGYLDGNKFNVVKEVKDTTFYYGTWFQYEINEKYDTTLTYSETLKSNKWILRAYYGSGEYAPYVDSVEFSIPKTPLRFNVSPMDVFVTPDGPAEITWETNFNAKYAEIGYLEDNQFVPVKKVEKYSSDGWSYTQVNLGSSVSTEVYYGSVLPNKNTWVVKAYYDDNYSTISDTFTIRKATTSGACGNNLTWSYEGGVLSINGTGAMYNYDGTIVGSAPWSWLSGSIKEVMIGSGVTTIGKKAFSNCSSIEKVTLSSSVIRIGAYAFNYCRSLKTVDLLNVKYIEDHAFYQAGLETFTSAGKFAEISESSFERSELINIEIPSGVKTIGKNAFASNYSLKSVVLPESLRTIGYGAFKDCTKLNSITMPKGVETIEDSAFSNCRVLTEIVFPKSLQTLGAYAFSGCKALTRIEFKGNAPFIGAKAFENVNASAYYVYGNNWTVDVLVNYGGQLQWIPLQKCGDDLYWSMDYTTGELKITGTGKMYSYDGTTSRPGWYSRRDEIKSVTIGVEVTFIGRAAFEDCSNLKTILFLGSAPIIYNPAFKGVTATAYYLPLSGWSDVIQKTYGGNITWTPYTVPCGPTAFWSLEDGVLTIYGTGHIGDFEYPSTIPWFEVKDEIKSVVIKENIDYIGKNAFNSCSKIKSVKIEAPVTTIGEQAFYNCTSLETVQLPSGLKTIGKSAFSNCISLDDVILPNGLTNIDMSAFYSCSSLDSIVIPDSVSVINVSAFYNCQSLKSVSVGSGIKIIGRDTFALCSSLTEVTLPDGLEEIGNSAFYGCASLEYIDIPDTVDELQSSAFRDCSSLVDIYIPDGVVEIGVYTFSGCSSLKKIKLPSALLRVENYAFEGCESLTEAYYYGTPDFLNRHITKGINNDALWDIVRCVRAEGDCSKTDSTEYSDVMWRLFWDGELRIFGFGKMNSYENPNSASDSNKIAPWNEFKDDITCVIIEDGVTNVGSFAFYNLSNLKSAILPEGINSIEKFAFAFCAFSTLELPDTITEIQINAFVNCNNLVSIVIPDGVQEISNDTFFRCKALTTVTIPESVTKIGKEAFRECVALTEITIPSNVTIIDNYAFDGCTGLEKVELNEGLKTINTNAFSNCSSLKEIVIPSTVTYIGNKGFSKCTSLKTVIFTGNAPLISTNRSFENVSTYAYYPANNSTWTESVRQDYGGTIKWVALGEGELIVKFSHSCVLNNNLGINYYIPKDEVDGFDEFRLVIKKQVFDGAGSSFSWTETTLSNYSEATVDGVDYLCFGYYGIAAKEMGSELRATLYMKRDGVQYSTTVDIYSVAEYAYNRLNKSSDDRLKTLLVDMLDYGAASQTYLKYNTSNLVNAKLTSAQRAYGSEMPQPVPNELLISVEGNTAHFYGKSLILGNNVEIKYYMTFDNGKPADSVKLVLSYTSIDGKEYTKVVKASDFVYESKYKAYSASIDSIGAKDMSCVVTAKIYDGDTLIGDVCKYSIETYVYNRLQKSTDENLKAAVIAMYKYGKSAEQYFLNK